MKNITLSGHIKGKTDKRRYLSDDLERMGGGNMDRIKSEKEDEENEEEIRKEITRVSARTHTQKHTNTQTCKHTHTTTSTSIHIHSEFEIRDCNNSFL